MTKNNSPGVEEAIRCDLCGNPTALEFDGQHVCEECYQGRSSCCPEFGKDDLWVFEDEEPDEAERADDRATRVSKRS